MHRRRGAADAPPAKRQAPSRAAAQARAQSEAPSGSQVSSQVRVTRSAVSGRGVSAAFCSFIVEGNLFLIPSTRVYFILFYF
jgi:hypothetical protein